MGSGLGSRAARRGTSRLWQQHDSITVFGSFPMGFCVGVIHALIILDTFLVLGVWVFVLVVVCIIQESIDGF